MNCIVEPLIFEKMSTGCFRISQYAFIDPFPDQVRLRSFIERLEDRGQELGYRVTGIEMHGMPGRHYHDDSNPECKSDFSGNLYLEAVNGSGDEWQLDIANTGEIGSFYYKKGTMPKEDAERGRIAQEASVSRLLGD